MLDRLEQTSAAVPGSFLYIAEQAHRTNNDYASAIAALRLAERRTACAHSRAAVAGVTRKLAAFAALQTLLKPPAMVGRIDLADYLIRLCGAFAVARFEDRPIALSIATADAILLEASRCWRAALIVAEFITNAERHAFTERGEGGEIAVMVFATPVEIVCSVSDTGTGPKCHSPGLGSDLVDRLAEDLGGHIVRRASPLRMTVELRIPHLP